MTTITFGNAPAPRLRLTQRGRTVFGALIAIPLIALAILVGPNVLGAQAGDAPVVNSFTYVSVAPGQSLWQLAEQVAPQADPREVIADILTLNNLSSGDVQPGQQLAIPAQYAQ
jgi:LysM domain-containing protein